MSCTSAGNCGAGGSYIIDNAHYQAFVVTETNGTWQQAKSVPGIATLLNQARAAAIQSMSCASAGNCGADGYYFQRNGDEQVFVVSETSGTWQTAQEVPGTAALNTGGTAYINSVSCGSASNRSAGGYYTDGSGHNQAFVVSKT